MGIKETQAAKVFGEKKKLKATNRQLRIFYYKNKTLGVREIQIFPKGN